MSVGTAPGLFDATTLVRHAAGDLPAGGSPTGGSPAGSRSAGGRSAGGREAGGHAGGRRAFGPRAVGLREGGELRAREVRAGHSSPRRESAGRGSVPPPSGLSTAQARPGPPLPQAARDLLIDASRGLGRAIRATNPADRYAAAHLAALRAAAAVLAARARPVRVGGLVPGS